LCSASYGSQDSLRQPMWRQQRWSPIQDCECCPASRERKGRGRPQAVLMGVWVLGTMMTVSTQAMLMMTGHDGLRRATWKPGHGAHLNRLHLHPPTQMRCKRETNQGMDGSQTSHLVARAIDLCRTLLHNSHLQISCLPFLTSKLKNRYEPSRSL
jgi:hypothetical protein